MKETAKIGEDGFGTYKRLGVYDEQGDGNHRCSWCNLKMRTGQEAISSTSPNTHGYRRHDTIYYHAECLNST